MFYVYILQSIDTQDQTYIGFTEDLKQRIKDHNSGHSKHTSKFKPWQLIHASAFAEKKKALDFEKYLKTASGKAFLRKRLI